MVASDVVYPGTCEGAMRSFKLFRAVDELLLPGRVSAAPVCGAISTPPPAAPSAPVTAGTAASGPATGAGVGVGVGPGVGVGVCVGVYVGVGVDRHWQCGVDAAAVAFGAIGDRGGVRGVQRHVRVCTALGRRCCSRT